MSKVKIQGNASGTGIFTVAAPATNTDRTITLPDVDATVLTTAGGNVAGELTLSHADEAGLKFKSTGTDGVTAAKILFEDTAGGVGGILRFDHDDNSFKFSTAGDTERMKIDSSGRVTKPYQPAFLVTKTDGNQSSGTIVFSSVQLNTGSCYNNSNGRFTAPITGRYLICFSGITPGSGGSCWINMFLNGSQYGLSGYAYVSSGYGNLGFSVVIQLNAGDYIYLTANGGGLYAAGDGGNPRFSGSLLG